MFCLAVSAAPRTVPGTLQAFGRRGMNKRARLHHAALSRELPVPVRLVRSAQTRVAREGLRMCSPSVIARVNDPARVLWFSVVARELVE